MWIAQALIQTSGSAWSMEKKGQMTDFYHILRKEKKG